MKFSQDEIRKVVTDNKMVRINLNLRTPMYGKMVACSDYEDMLSKGFVRFVISGRVELFEGTSYDDSQKIYKGSERIAKLIAIKEITYIKQYENGIEI